VLVVDKHLKLFCLLEQPDAGEDPEFVRAKYFFRDEFLVKYLQFMCFYWRHVDIYRVKRPSLVVVCD